MVAHNCFSLVVACTNVLYTLVILNQTVWSQISSNCANNSHEAQLVMLLYCYVLINPHKKKTLHAVVTVGEKPYTTEDVPWSNYRYTLLYNATLSQCFHSRAYLQCPWPRRWMWTTPMGCALWFILTFDHPVEGIAKLGHGIISDIAEDRLLEEASAYCVSRWLLTVKNADWPRVSCGCLHWDVMDGSRLLPRRDPANGASITFQSEALKSSV